MAGLGTVVLILGIFVYIASWGHLTGPALLGIGLAYGLIGFIFGRTIGGSVRISTLMICLSYLVLIPYSLNGALLSRDGDNPLYGYYDRKEFFIIPAFLYVFPVLLAYFGFYAGSRRSIKAAVALIFLTLLAIAGVPSVIPAVQDFETKGYHSFRFIDREDITLDLEVRCDYRTKKIYWIFTTKDNESCSDAKVSVVRRRTDLALPIQAYWTIDGKEQLRSIVPINRPDGGTSLGHPNDRNFDNFPTWRMEIPFGHIRHAKNVKFRWGAIELEFAEKEFAEIKRLNEKLEQLRSEL